MIVVNSSQNRKKIYGAQHVRSVYYLEKIKKMA